jgi:hypothetical protein
VTSTEDTIKRINAAKNNELTDILTGLTPYELEALGAELAATPEDPTPPGPSPLGVPAIGERTNRDFASAFIKNKSPGGSG